METKQTMGDVTQMKKRARAIQTRFKELGLEIKLGHALEAQAVACGYPNWATLTGVETAAATLPTVTAVPAENFYEEVRDVARRVYTEQVNKQRPSLIFSLIINDVCFLMEKIGDPFQVIDRAYKIDKGWNTSAGYQLKRELGQVLYNYATHLAHLAISEIIMGNLPKDIDSVIAGIRKSLFEERGMTVAERYAEHAKAVIDQMDEILKSMRETSQAIDSTYLRLASELPDKLKRFMSSLVTEMDYERKTGKGKADWFDEPDKLSLELVFALEQYDKEAFTKIVCDAIRQA